MKDIKRFQRGKEQITKKDPVIQILCDFSKAVLENEHNRSIMSKFQEKKKNISTQKISNQNEDVLKKT